MRKSYIQATALIIRISQMLRFEVRNTWLLPLGLVALYGLFACPFIRAQPLGNSIRGVEPSSGPDQNRSGEGMQPAFESPFAQAHSSEAGYPFPPVDDSAPSDGAESLGRSVGLGDPLVGTSWLNRPFHVGWMFGGLFGDELIKGRIEQHEDMVGGYRVGWDFDHYWGIEGRYLFSHLELTDQLDTTISHTSQNHYWDVDLLYYPWGDSRWRPYASVGLGWANFEFGDALDQEIEKTLITMPVGAGFKYFWKNWLALRISVSDNLAIGRDPLDTMHNISLTGDIEVHFGGPRLSYFPYHGSIHLW